MSDPVYQFAQVSEASISWRLRRNCSVTPAQLITVYLMLCAVSLVIGGFFRSLQFTSLNALAFADMKPEDLVPEAKKDAKTSGKTMREIDLNADLGEGCGHDAALLGIVTSANVAAGAHAGVAVDGSCEEDVEPAS